MGRLELVLHITVGEWATPTLKVTLNYLRNTFTVTTPMKNKTKYLNQC